VNLGLACLSFLLERFKPEGIANSGINVKTKVIYQLYCRGDATVLSGQPERGGISHSQFARSIGRSRDGAARLVEIAGIGDLELVLANLPRTLHPVKDLWYFRNRYCKHPGFTYRLYGIELAGGVRGVFATRRIAADGSAVLRIVDYIGDPEVLGECGPIVCNGPYRRVVVGGSCVALYIYDRMF
jgi:hypothetical protein